MTKNVIPKDKICKTKFATFTKVFNKDNGCFFNYLYFYYITTLQFLFFVCPLFVYEINKQITWFLLRN